MTGMYIAIWLENFLQMPTWHIKITKVIHIWWYEFAKNFVLHMHFFISWTHIWFYVFLFQGLVQQKVITTILRTLPTNIISVAKPSIAGASGTNTVSVSSGSPKQTFVIAAPGAGKGGTPAKIISSVPKITGSPSILVSSAASGVKTVFSQAGDKGTSFNFGKN